MYQRSDVREGMTVRSIDGEKLGKVFAVQAGEFLIEKGLFFPKDYVCRYSEIGDIRDGEIILVHGKEGLHRFSFDEERGVLAGTGEGTGSVGVPMEPTTGIGMDTAGVAANMPLPTQERPVMQAASEVRMVEVDIIEEEPRAGQPERPEDVVVRSEGELEAPRKLDLTPDDPKLRRS